jgi:hypothetical protein
MAPQVRDPKTREKNAKLENCQNESVGIGGRPLGFDIHLQTKMITTPLHFIVENGIQQKLISVEFVKILNLSIMPHPQPYIIGWLSQGRDFHIS